VKITVFYGSPRKGNTYFATPHYGACAMTSLVLTVSSQEKIFNMFTTKWDKIPTTKQAKFEKRLRQSAKIFFKLPKTRPHISAVVFYHMSKMVVKKYVGKGNHPYKS